PALTSPAAVAVHDDPKVSWQKLARHGRRIFERLRHRRSAGYHGAQPPSTRAPCRFFAKFQPPVPTVRSASHGRPRPCSRAAGQPQPRRAARQGAPCRLSAPGIDSILRPAPARKRLMTPLAETLAEPPRAAVTPGGNRMVSSRASARHTRGPLTREG